MIPPGPLNDPAAAYQRQIAQESLQRSQTAGQRSGENLTAEIAERAQSNANRATDVRRTQRPPDATNRTEAPAERRDVGARQDRIDIRRASGETEPQPPAARGTDAAAATARGAIAADRTGDAGRATEQPENGPAPQSVEEGAQAGPPASDRAAAERQAPDPSAAEADTVTGTGDVRTAAGAADRADAETERRAAELAGTLSILNGAATTGSLVNLSI